MNRTKRRRSDSSGFTLVELLLAFSLLLVGMTGVISLFAAGLNLEREGAAAFDSGIVLDELMPEVIEKLRQQAVRGDVANLRVPRTSVPGQPGLDYEVEAEPMPGDSLGQGYLVRVTLLAPSTRGDRRYTHGWLPMSLSPGYEELIRDVVNAK